MSSLTNKPVSREGWFNYYVGVFNKTGRETAAHLALWYRLLDLAEDAC